MRFDYLRLVVAAMMLFNLCTVWANGEQEEESFTDADPTTQPLQYWKDASLRKYFSAAPWLKDIKISGYIAQSFTVNGNKPDNFTNTYRVFDYKDRRYMFNVFQIAVSKEATEDSRWGFGTKLDLGLDPNIMASYNQYADNDAGIDEAYVSYLFPLGKGLLVKAGKMTALAGAEVAEEKDNWNISRSFLCAFSSPFTNTGVRAQYTFNEMFDLTVGAHRGWDICFQDNNSVESYEARLGMNLTEKFNVALCVMRGAEQDKNDSDQLSLLDLVATYKFTDKLTGMLNADIGMDEHAAPDGGDAYWNGLAAYLKYDWTEKFSVAARAETFHDPDGVCTGEGQTLAECTLTAQYKFRENLWGRIEYRRDSSNADVFLRGIGMSENQNTIAASLLFTF